MIPTCLELMHYVVETVHYFRFYSTKVFNVQHVVQEEGYEK